MHWLSGAAGIAGRLCRNRHFRTRQSPCSPLAPPGHRRTGHGAALFVERFITANKNARFYLPSLEEAEAISFAELREQEDHLRTALEEVEQTAQKLTPENLAKALTGSQGHSSTSYVNRGSLTEDYFRDAEAALAEPWLYIVISDTGTAASEIIGSVTRKVYNHASLSFDRELKTTLSYNGGANLYPPGLNPEMVAHFHQKPDASVLVYRIAANREQKQRVLDAVARINWDAASLFSPAGISLAFRSSVLPSASVFRAWFPSPSMSSGPTLYNGAGLCVSSVSICAFVLVH